MSGTDAMTVREFAMSAMLSGLALHGGLMPSGGTFLVFPDYARNGLRLAVSMPSTTVFDRQDAGYRQARSTDQLGG